LLFSAGGPSVSTPSSCVDDLEKHAGLHRLLGQDITRSGVSIGIWLTPKTHAPLLRRSAWLSPLRLHHEDLLAA
jgi:hypothetical protein